jgi:alpha,alpha-trehalose phosphorylase
MNDFLIEEWRVIESAFRAECNQTRESVFSLANGYMGVRGVLEEGFSGSSQLDATYAAVLYCRLKALPQQIREHWKASLRMAAA